MRDTKESRRVLKTTNNKMSLLERQKYIQRYEEALKGGR
jgi:hypothetical protein